MGELITKIFAVFALIVFVSILIHHGQIDFTAWDAVTEKTGEAIQSEQGQALTKEIKDTSYDVATTFVQKFRSDATKAALDEMKLVRVVDGDTLIVQGKEGQDIYVRLIGLDTPESVNPDESKNTTYGSLASDYTKALLTATDTVYLQYDKELHDQYDRTLAYVWLKNDVDTSSTQDVANYMLNGLILRNGYGMDKIYKPNVRYADVFAELRSDAQAVNAGLWSEKGFQDLW